MPDTEKVRIRNKNEAKALERSMKMQVIDIELARKVVSFVRENPDVTPEQLVRNIPELAACESLDFALDCCPQDNGFLIAIDENNHVQLGDAAHFVDERI